MAGQTQGPLHNHLAHFLATRTPPKTFCPSEVARACTASELETLGVGSWRDLMPEIRRIVWEERDQRRLEVLQKGQVLGADVALEDVKGPIRVRTVALQVFNADEAYKLDRITGSVLSNPSMAVRLT
ncbi:hypothetical protein LTR50_005221 [Elasticomyces elasticus]|nr:hypothetical protein LTR50_005221 [Elasticomyces elasticus]